MKQQSSGFSVTRNHNYTISVHDAKGRKIDFRDITGEDLELLDRLIGDAGGDDEKKHLSFDDVVSVLTTLSVKELDFTKLTQRIIIQLFEAIKEHILCNYMTKYTWLKQCYNIQNGSFASLALMEKVPMTKFIAMIQVHKEAIESINKPTE
jgi:hypothetical protein